MRSLCSADQYYFRFWFIGNPLSISVYKFFILTIEFMSLRPLIVTIDKSALKVSVAYF